MPVRGTISQEKEIEVHSSARLLVPPGNLCSAGQASCSSQHCQLCCCDLHFLIQNHMAPPHGPPARVLSPLSFVWSHTVFCHSLPLSLLVLHCLSHPSWWSAFSLNSNLELLLEHHFWLLPQSTNLAALLYFQPFLAAKVSPRKHGLMARSASSPSSCADSGNCYPATSQVKATPISLASLLSICKISLLSPSQAHGGSYIPGHPRFWTPLQIPPFGGPGTSQPTLCYIITIQMNILLNLNMPMWSLYKMLCMAHS